MKPATVLVLFGVTALLQLVVPLNMIRGHEAVLKHGTAYTFRVQPIDPNDPFRGRYVRLGFDAPALPWPAEEGRGHTVEAWITLAVDGEGFAEPKAIHLEAPDDPSALKVKLYTHPRENGGAAGFENLQYDAQVYYPFDRFYMEEFLAPEAERLMQNRREPLDAEVVVRIYNGAWAIEDLIVEGIPIAEYLRQRPADASAS